MRLAVTVVLLVCTASAQESSPEQLFRDAVAAQQRGDYATAVARYQELVKLRPDVPQVRANLGAALAQLGRFDEAIAEYERALAAAPEQMQIRLNLGLAYYKTGAIDRARAEFEKLHAAAPSEKRFTLLLADCLLSEGENAKAIALLDPFDYEYRDDLTFSYLYGTALMREGREERGKQVMDRIFRNGDSAEARFLMGMARFKKLDYHGAEEEIKRAIELNPKLPGLHSFYGEVLDGLMDGGARAQYEKELELNPNDFSANLHLGVDALRERKLDIAEQHLKRSLAVRPGDPGALLQLANLRSAQDRREEAAQILEALVKRFPGFREAHVVLANTYYRLKRTADGDRERAIVKKLTDEPQAQTTKSDTGVVRVH